MDRRDVEPWLRGTLSEIDPVRRQVLHALELAAEDVARWCGTLTDAEMHARPFGLASLAFHLRHIARSLDRLLTYAEGGALDERQMLALRSEMEAGMRREQLFAEFESALASARDRVLAIAPERFAEMRGVGREQLPVSVAGLLIHCAEHTQRHVGQAVTTTHVVVASRAGANTDEERRPQAPRS